MKRDEVIVVSDGNTGKRKTLSFSARELRVLCAALASRIETIEERQRALRQHGFANTADSLSDEKADVYKLWERASRAEMDVTP